MTIKENKAKGFTLLELLIVIAILAILSVALVLMLNPAETLKKGRDSQRMSDLATMKTALGLYLTTEASPNLTSEATANDSCLNSTGTATIFYSNSVTGMTAAGFAAATGNTTTGVEGTNGWLPVDFTAISGGSPISNLPLDPINSVAVATAAKNTDLVYRYACDKNNLTFEINATLESDAFTSVDNKHANDGGNNANLFEVGSSLTVLPGDTTF